MAKMNIGGMLFLAVTVIAIIVAFIPIAQVTQFGIVLLLGLAAGFFVVTGKETTPFLVALLFLIAAGTALSLGVLPVIGTALTTVVQALTIAWVGVGLIPAFKMGFKIGKN